MNYGSRLDQARQLMAEQGLGILLVGQPANRRYLTGFSWNDDSSQSSSGWVVLTPTDGFFVTNFLHFEAVETGVRHLEAVKAQSRILDALVGLLEARPSSRIGFEGGWVSYSLFEEWNTRLGSRHSFVAVDGLVEKLRVTKDRDEISILRRASAMTDDAFVAVTSALRIGQTEREIAWALERSLRERGADGMAFGPSVAAGPHAAIPHHEPTDYAVKAGDPIWIDMGAQVDGYCGDLTRSFCLDEASDQFLATWNLVLAAQQAALTKLRSNQTGKEADEIARNVFESAGRAAEFGHSLGHGVGLMIHEAPRLAATSTDVLQPGMIVTVEPGLYVPGWGGVRIEDVALIESDNISILSHAPKQPIIYSLAK